MERVGYLPVHCCCDPGQRLGWLPEVEGYTLHTRLGFKLDIAYLYGWEDGADIQAYQNEDHPVELLRQIPGWQDDPVYFGLTNQKEI